MKYKFIVKEVVAKRRRTIYEIESLTIDKGIEKLKTKFQNG